VQQVRPAQPDLREPRVLRGRRAQGQPERPAQRVRWAQPDQQEPLVLLVRGQQVLLEQQVPPELLDPPGRLAQPVWGRQALRERRGLLESPDRLERLAQPVWGQPALRDRLARLDRTGIPARTDLRVPRVQPVRPELSRPEEWLRW
jgi:hypothetical protein